MPERLSPSLLALGLALSSLISGCQTAVPSVAHPAASFALGSVEVAEPSMPPRIRTLTGNTAPTSASEPEAEPSVVPKSEPHPETRSGSNSRSSDKVVPPAPIQGAEVEATPPTEEQATPTTEPLFVRESESEATAPTEQWEIIWRLEGAEDQREVFALVVKPDGTLRATESFEDPEFESGWFSDTLQFEVGRGFLFGPQSGFVAQRYALTRVAPDRLEGTTALLINFRWIEFPATAVRLEEVDSLEN